MFQTAYKRLVKVLKDDRGAVYVEYSMLTSFMILASIPLLPGGPLYKALQDELILRVNLISYPIF